MEDGKEKEKAIHPGDYRHHTLINLIPPISTCMIIQFYVVPKRAPCQLIIQLYMIVSNIMAIIFWTLGMRDLTFIKSVKGTFQRNVKISILVVGMLRD